VVVAKSTIPYSSLNERHDALEDRQVCEIIAAKILGYYWFDGKANPAVIVSKHWGYQQIRHLLQAALFNSSNTYELVISD
jgi:hypothetical protein